MADDARLAVLIDADNAQAARAEALLKEIATLGAATVKRAYGDWTSPNLKKWKDVLHVNAITPIQQFSYTTGKNSTDSAMIIDAMDLLYTGSFDGFCLVTSDSDFTMLASRLRQSGAKVYGFGQRRTPESLVAACDRFIYVEVLADEQAPASDRAPARASAAKLRGDAKLVSLLRAGVSAVSDDEGWAFLGPVGSTITKQAPDFDPRNWGFAKLSALIEATDLFEMDRRTKNVRVRATRTKS